MEKIIDVAFRMIVSMVFASDPTFSYLGDTYLITSDLKYSIYNHDIELRIDSQNQMKALFAGRELSCKKTIKGPKKMAV